MRLFIVITLLALQGCASYRPLCPGTRSYDPQVCRGEKFERLPNFVNEAQIRRQRGEYW
jgi:hypothetical protein